MNEFVVLRIQPKTGFYSGTGARPTSYTMGTWLFPGLKRPGRDGIHPDVAPRLKKEYNYIFMHPLKRHGML